MSQTDPAIAAALKVMDSHISALNAGDATRLARTLHFPHLRLSGADLTIWDTPETYLADFHARAGDDWARSRADDIQVVGASETKVHLDVQITRFRADDSRITSFRSLWVITREAGHWAAKIRSSFANR